MENGYPAFSIHLYSAFDLCIFLVDIGSDRRNFQAGRITLFRTEYSDHEYVAKEILQQRQFGVDMGNRNTIDLFDFFLSLFKFLKMYE